MPKPTLEYLQSRLILELEQADRQKEKVEDLKRQIDELKNTPPRFGDDGLYMVDTILTWRHTYGPQSRRRHTYTFVAIKVAANKWRVRNDTISWNELVRTYLMEADDGEVYAADHFKRI